jgi:hypothetical protein
LNLTLYRRASPAGQLPDWGLEPGGAGDTNR